MSKHALEAFTDTLAIELSKFNVQVSIIDPGGFNSNIGRNIFQRLQRRGLDVEDSLYSVEWKNNWVLAGGDLSSMKDPTFIVDRIEHALFDPNPQHRYMVVGDPERAENTIRAILHRMLELNQSQDYTYNRDELVSLMQEEMEKLEAGKAGPKSDR
jgi:NAD(P)-dependent dehydrogenase (short-subunit alcohol dehydrogenase family)